MSTHRLLLLLALPAMLAPACGWDDVELAATARGGNSVHPGDSGVDGGGITLPAPPDASIAETGSFACDAHASSATCRSLGDTCGAGSDCCSQRCEGGTCLPAGACAEPGAPCAARADCCSGRCEPATGTTARVCSAVCRPAGAACAKASDCCGFDCNGGKCTGAVCAIQGSTCTSASQCCSNLCDATGKCLLDPQATCRGIGEDCGSGAQSTCCGTCDAVTERCDPGPGPCLLPGAICAQSADCCEGTCSGNGTDPSVCTSACLTNGVTCRAGFECCSGACVGDPPQCGAPPVACLPSGSACAQAVECCSAVCQGGSCQAACASSAP